MTRLTVHREPAMSTCRAVPYIAHGTLHYCPQYLTSLKVPYRSTCRVTIDDATHPRTVRLAAALTTQTMSRPSMTGPLMVIHSLR